MKTYSVMPRVLVDARFRPQKRGGDRCRYELAIHLPRESDVRYCFLAYQHTKDELLSACGDSHVVTTGYRPDNHPQYDLYEHLALPLLTRRIHADIYHGTFNVIPLLSGAPSSIVTIADMAVFAFPQAYGKRFAPYMRALMTASIHRATRIIAISNATKREIIRYFPAVEGKIVAILCGVGSEFAEAVHIQPGVVTDVCRRLEVQRPYVLFVGNLEAKKNLARLVEAFHIVRSTSDAPHTLVIVGEQPEGLDSGLSSVGKRMLAQGFIRFTGYIDDSDLPTLYRGADLVAYPSLYEGFGMPVLEGMAAGVPVLTSSVSSLPEVADGAAMLVDPLDVDDIARGLYQALTDTTWRDTAVHKGRRRAMELSWEANATQTAAVYHDLYRG